MPKPLVQATGRRKTSVARVRLRDGSGQLTLNGRPLEDYFPTMASRMRVMEPLQITQTQGRYDVDATLEGGGTTGQVDALRLGIARALIVLDPELRPMLKKAGHADPRREGRRAQEVRPAQSAPGPAVHEALSWPTSVVFSTRDCPFSAPTGFAVSPAPSSPPSSLSPSAGPPAPTSGTARS